MLSIQETRLGIQISQTLFVQQHNGNEKKKSRIGAYYGCILVVLKSIKGAMCFWQKKVFKNQKMKPNIQKY